MALWDHGSFSLVLRGVLGKLVVLGDSELTTYPMAPSTKTTLLLGLRVFKQDSLWTVWEFPKN